MRVLVTGSSGFIGSHLVKALKDRGDSVLELDILTGHDIRKWGACQMVRGCDEVYHQAAISTIEECEKNPLAAHETNVTGFLNVLLAAKSAGVKRFVYASSAAVHGNSVYGATKRANEAYAGLFPSSVGLRYYNVIGGPKGVVARWTELMRKGLPVEIYGDGEQLRDFVPIADVVRANLERPRGLYSVKSGKSITINELFRRLADELGYKEKPIYRPARVE